MKRWMTLLLAALVLASVLCLPAPLGGIREAEAASTVTKSTVQSRLTKIQNSLNGVIWTTDQTVCDDNACTKCNTSNILKQTWFKNKAKADGLLIPSSFSMKHYYYGTGLKNGYTCCGFANYVGWYLFASSAGSSITFKQYKKGSYTYDTMKSAMPGDIIRLGSKTSGGGSHSAVVVSVSSTGVKVFDDNKTSHNKVATHTIKYSSYTYVTISRATNYDTTTTYTVSYDANGGYGAPASQTKTQGQTLYLSSTIPSYDSETWSDYTVYFDANGGTVNTASLSGSRTLQYSFDRWGTSNTDGGTYYAPGDAYTTDANVTLYAMWLGAWKCSSIVLPTPTRNGYTFAGWYDEDGYFAGNGGQTYSQTLDTDTLYAHWTPKSYTVTLNPNGGTCGTSTKTVTYGQAYGTMPVPTRKGYTFAGWWTAKTGGKKVTASTICYASGNYTLYARWTEGYTMTFNPNGGTVSPTTKVVKYGQQYGALPTPTRAGYTFAGWWTAKTGGKQVTASTVCYASAGYTLYARWTAKKFVVTLNPNGGECATATKTVTYGQAYGTMPVPSPRTGYTFAGWYTAKTGGKKVTATTICYATGNYTLYARWTPKTYTVSFNPNGGSCTVGSKTVTYGQTYGTLPVPTRDGYVFAGWFTTQTTGGKQVLSNTVCYATGNYTLYARWWKN